jgi:hypothetical protein
MLEGRSTPVYCTYLALAEGAVVEKTVGAVFVVDFHSTADYSHRLGKKYDCRVNNLLP